MKGTAQRAILRWIHLIFAIPIVGYVYRPFAELPNYAPIARYIAFPIILVSGLHLALQRIDNRSDFIGHLK
jgi:predicted tellurium resistance membrane protein TerC